MTNSIGQLIDQTMEAMGSRVRVTKPDIKPIRTIAKTKIIWVVRIAVPDRGQEQFHTFSSHKKAMDFIGGFVFDQSNPNWKQQGQEHWNDGKTYIAIKETALNKT